MPRAHYVAAGYYTAAAAGTGVATPMAGDTFNVPNFDSGNGYLENAWATGASTDFVRIRSARMHDVNQGLRLLQGGSSNNLLQPWEAAQRLYSGDNPTVEIDETAAATGAIAVSYSFDDMPGVNPRLASWDDVSSRVQNISGADVLVSAVAAIGQWSPGVAINSTYDNFQADSDYALLGFLTASSVTALAVTGQDTGNLKVGGPGISDPKVTRDYFIRMSRETARPCIPVIAANNKGGTLVAQTDNTAHAAQHVTLILAQLK